MSVKYRTPVESLIIKGKIYIGDGYRAKNSELGSNGLPFARAGNLNNGFNFQNADFFPLDMIKKVGNKLSEIGDVVFTSKGTIGRFGFVTNRTQQFVYSPQLCFWRSLDYDVIDPKYLFYWMNSPLFLDQVSVVSGLTDMAPYVNLKDQRKMLIDLPSLPIQQKIASILSSYDELIENNKQRIKLLEEMAEEIYKEWFVRLRFPSYEKATIVDGLPEGWENGTIGDLVEFKKGKNITLDTVSAGNVPVVAGGLTPAYYHNVANTISPTITISASGANAGFVNLYYEDIWASDCSYLDTKSTDFLYYFYLTLKTKQIEVTALQKGSAQPHVYPKDIMTLKMKKSSDNLVKKFENLITSFFEEIKTLIQKNQLLQETRDLLLPRLISGKLSVEHLVEEKLAMVAEERATYIKV